MVKTKQKNTFESRSSGGKATTAQSHGKPFNQVSNNLADYFFYY